MMNNIIFTVTKDFIPSITYNRAETISKKSGVVSQTIRREENRSVFLSSTSKRKIKFALGCIYFISLLFFTIKLFA
jgi:hypothetical protein